MSEEEYIDDLDYIAEIVKQNKKLINENVQLQQENKKLKEDLRVSQSNEETYSLEMQEITKILGLDEDTLFDDVKECVKLLNEEHNKKLRVFMAYNSYYSILRDLEEWLKKHINAYEERIKLGKGYELTLVMQTHLQCDKNTLEKIQKLKEKYE